MKLSRLARLISKHRPPKVLGLIFARLALPLALRIESASLAAMAIRLGMYGIYPSREDDVRKPVLILYPKLGGIEDFRASVTESRSLWFKPVIVPDIFWGMIGLHFGYRSNTVQSLPDLEEFLSRVLSDLRERMDIAGFVTQNLDYRPMPQIATACHENGIPFILSYKECLRTKNQRPFWEQDFRVLYSGLPVSAISVYSQIEREALISSLDCDGRIVRVIGNPRMDSQHLARTEAGSLGNDVVLFAIDSLAGVHSPFGLANTIGPSWNLEATLIEKWFLQIARLNPDFDFKIKVKIGQTESQFFRRFSEKLPGNVQVVTGGLGTDLIANARAVVAFNSTTIFEAIARGAHVFVPDMVKMVGGDVSDWVLDLGESVGYFHSFDTLNKILTSSLSVENANCLDLSNGRDDVLEKYMGNSDGRSGDRGLDFLLLALDKQEHLFA